MKDIPLLQKQLEIDRILQDRFGLLTKRCFKISTVRHDAAYCSINFGLVYVSNYVFVFEKKKCGMGYDSCL